MCIYIAGRVWEPLKISSARAFREGGGSEREWERRGGEMRDKIKIGVEK